MSPLLLLLVGTFVVLVVVAWHLVLALRQARRTAEAIERFLEQAGPSVLGTAEHLRSLTARADRIMAVAEEGSRLSSSLTRALSVVSGVLAGLQKVWSLAFGREAATEESKGAAGSAAP